MTRLLLLRHGQSEWNAQGRWQGQADPPLTDEGRLQAARASERIGSVDVIVTSDLERAAVTAAIISELVGIGPVVTEPRLRERHAGPWSGLTRDEIEASWPGYLDADRRPDGFEPDEMLWERVRDGLDHIERTWRGATVLVVTHGGVVYTLERYHGITERRRLPNLGAREVIHHGNRLSLGERLELGGPLGEPLGRPPGEPLDRPSGDARLDER